jgi:hypothetical protein
VFVSNRSNVHRLYKNVLLCVIQRRKIPPTEYHIIGAVCYGLINDKNKMSTRGKKFFFIGYGESTKGFKDWDKEEN